MLRRIWIHLLVRDEDGALWISEFPVNGDTSKWHERKAARGAVSPANCSFKGDSFAIFCRCSKLSPDRLSLRCFEFAFDTLDIFMALKCATHSGREPEWYWAHAGALWYRYENREAILEEIEGSMANNADKSPYVTSKLFGNTVAECNRQLAGFKRFMSKFRWY